MAFELSAVASTVNILTVPTKFNPQEDHSGRHFSPNHFQGLGGGEVESQELARKGRGVVHESNAT